MSIEEPNGSTTEPYDYEIVGGRKIRVRPTETGSEVDPNGYFRRQGNQYTRSFEGVPGAVGQITGRDLYDRPTQGLEAPLKAEPYRYRLVWAKLCHWSNRAAIVRELEGLEDAISVNMVEHAEHDKNLGWEFIYNENNIDPVLGDQFLSESYYRALDDYRGRTTVPALIDAREGRVVCNDYNWLTNYLEVSFRPFHKVGAPDLYPEALREEIDKRNLWLFDNINNAVYRCLFSLSRQGYSQGYRTFYAAMDVLERHLATHRFLFGDYVTDSDIRLYVTLARLDVRYTSQLGETRQRLVDYPNLWGYARDLWQIPAFRNNTYFVDYATPGVNETGIGRATYNYRFLKQIDFAGLWGQPTDRARLSGDPAHKFLAEEDGGSARSEDGGFIGYTQTLEEREAWERDAQIYAQIRSIPSTRSLLADTPIVKSIDDLPAFEDRRPQMIRAILQEIDQIPEAPSLDLTHGLVGEAVTEAERALADAQRYVQDNVTDTITTLIRTVLLPEFEEAYSVLYAAFDQLEERLARRRYLLGDYVSMADVQLFASLVRFDAQYSWYLGATRHRLVDYPNLWAYARDLYQIPAFRHSVDWKEFAGKPASRELKKRNAFYDYVLPALDLDEIWQAQTDRAYLSSDPTHEFLYTDNRRFDR